MISILIPIYNYDVSKLAKKLKEQCVRLNIEFEILCFDDCSTDKYKKLNRVLDHEFGISYLEMSENLGRSKIRNRLAKMARYENLIFLDCDSKIISDQFVQKYIQKVDTAAVIYGGRRYPDHKPRTEKKFLHWHYGKIREALPLEKRIKHPYRSFQTNNFFIKKDLMLKYPFDETIQTYGYEDLLMAENLKKDGIPIIHIENPIIHKGIEYNEDFIKKSVLAAENLAVLYHNHQITDTRMIALYENLKKVGFNSFVEKLIRKRSERFLKNLNSAKPKLYIFDLYRLNVFIQKLNNLQDNPNSES